SSPLALSFFHTLPPPLSTLFPYTTLFRSFIGMRFTDWLLSVGRSKIDEINNALGLSPFSDATILYGNTAGVTDRYRLGQVDNVRSEEHTSELQSRENLVCRLLLEKKK